MARKRNTKQRTTKGRSGGGGRGQASLKAQQTRPVQRELHEMTVEELEQMLPDGPTTYWGDDDWTGLELTLERLEADGHTELSNDLWDKVMDRDWDYQQDREDAEYSNVVSMPAAKSIADMTDEEYTAYEHAVDSYDMDPPLPLPSKGSEDLESAPIIGAPNPYDVCTCNGPGSKDEKHKTHLGNCPAFAKNTKPGTVPYLECDCQGPGAQDMRFSTHLPKCPCYIKPTSYSTSSYNYKSCSHYREEVKLADDLVVYASSIRGFNKHWDSKEPRPEIADVDLGVYFASGWHSQVMVTAGLELPWMPEPELPSIMLDWPDFDEPRLDDSLMHDAVAWTLSQLRGGSKIEVACIGGHGRTGTFLACLEAALGVLPATAVAGIRERYCDDAVEGKKQVAYVAIMHELFHGPEWRHNKDEVEKYEKLLKSETTGSYSSGYQTTKYTKDKDGSWVPVSTVK